MFAFWARALATYRILLQQVSEKSHYIDMSIIGLAVEELMGDKFKSRYKNEEYASSTIAIDGSTELGNK